MKSIWKDYYNYQKNRKVIISDDVSNEPLITITASKIKNVASSYNVSNDLDISTCSAIMDELETFTRQLLKPTHLEMLILL